MEQSEGDMKQASTKHQHLTDSLALEYSVVSTERRLGDGSTLRYDTIISDEVGKFAYRAQSRTRGPVQHLLTLSGWLLSTCFNLLQGPCPWVRG